MQEWFDPATGNDMACFRACEQCGINTAQIGADVMHERIARYARQGGTLQWIATLYNRARWRPDAPSLEEELAEILAVDPKPIGLVFFGESVDRHFIDDDMDALREKLKRLRDTGLLIGVGSHLPEVIEQVDSEGWDVDFLQTCFYTVYTLVSRREIDRKKERFEDSDRQRMVDTIKSVSKPCLAFKVLGANRKCGSDEEIVAALRFAYENIKDTDAVILGMWQKYKDQVGQNVDWVRDILAERA
jgi:hypothetical protein